VRTWAASPPTWLTVREPSSLDPSLNLGAGEKAAIALAQEVQAARILVDDRDAVRAARARGLTPIGMLALLDEAAEREFRLAQRDGHTP
jgi:predicted nucleic acid-binding protein